MGRTLGCAAAAAVLLAGAALAAGAPGGYPAGARSHGAVLAPGTSLRVVVVPVRIGGAGVPSERRLRAMVRRLAAWYGGASRGRMRIEGAVARPVDGGPLARRLVRLEPAAFRALLDAAATRGAPVDGAIPIYVVPGLQQWGRISGLGDRSAADPEIGAVIVGSDWRVLSALVHEFGHTLGLSHSRTPICPGARPTRTCGDPNPEVNDYGDRFDVMGSGGDRLGAYPLAVLGLQPVTDAPPGRSRTAVRPPGGRDPTLLRLRTAGQDWFVESRTSLRQPVFRNRRFRLPRSVIVSRALSQYATRRAVFPSPYRIPATAETADRDCPPCVSRYLHRPGSSLTVPGAFRLRVLRGQDGDAVRVETTWLDRTPPSLEVVSASVTRPFGGAPPELVVDVRTRARGAGVLALEVDQGGSVTRIDPDAVPGLGYGPTGRATVRVSAGAAAAAARLRLLDAAGNASPWTSLPAAATRQVPAATVAVDPPLGIGPLGAPRLSGPRAVTIRGATDPAFAGLAWRIDWIGAASGRQILPIGPGGAFEAVWTPPLRERYRLVVSVPVERIPGGFDLRSQVVDGYVHG